MLNRQESVTICAFAYTQYRHWTDRRTEGRTDGRTDGRTEYLEQYRALRGLGLMLTRDKKKTNQHEKSEEKTVLEP